jgi:nucleotide-binding universal stress UspA family protein
VKILIAYDGTPGSRAVFDDLRRAALPERLEAHVVTVATTGRVASARSLLVEEAGLLADAGARHVRADFPGWTVVSEVVEGAPAAAILAAAHRIAADLIVVGTRGLDPAERAALGSVAREVVTNARRSVRVARSHGRQAGETHRILIGFDGSPGAADAIAEVTSRRWPPGTEVRLLAALANGNGPATAEGHPEAKLGPVAARLAGAGFRTTTAVRVGEARRTLLQEADAWCPESIFVGGRRLQKLRRFLFGSVAGEVADDAPCSVEVVRPELV